MNKQIQIRGEKLRNDIDRFENNIPKKFIKRWGSKGYKIAYICLSIQQQVIHKDIKHGISLPSLESFAYAFDVSTRHVARIINSLIKSKALNLTNYFKVDQNGEIETYEIIISNSKRKFIKTNGKLRKITNPFKGIKDFIQSKASERKAKAQKFIKSGWERYVKKYIDIHKLDYSSLPVEDLKTTKPDSKGWGIPIEEWNI